MSNRRKARDGFSSAERRLHREIRCPECGGRMGAPFRRPDGQVDAVVEHLDGCKTVNVFIDTKEGGYELA